MAAIDHSQSSGEPNSNAGFVYATCQVASNAWLRRDVARLHPELRLAFSASGLVTWKVVGPSSPAVASPLAVVAGWGVGPAKTVAEVRELVEACFERLSVNNPTIGLHVFHTARDVEAAEDTEGSLAPLLELETQLRTLRPFATGQSGAGTPIIDVIHLRDRPGSYFVGWHVQRFDRPTLAGGVEAKPLDPRAPSRAYSKVWELLRLGELSVAPGDTVVELGAAPGGGTVAWLECKASITAVDPAEMSPAVAAFASAGGARYRHLRKSAGELDAKELPPRVDFLYSDMNLAPAVVLRYLERVCSIAGPPLRAIALNLKVNDRKVESALTQQLQRFLAFGRRFGFEMRVAQLPSHRQEIGVVLRRAMNANVKGRSTQA